MTDDNIGSFGKIEATGLMSSGEVFVETNKQAKYGIINFSKSYTRNNYSFGNSDIYLYKLIYNDEENTFNIYEVKSGGEQVGISAFGDSIVFCDKRTTTGTAPTYTVDFTNSYCKTIRNNYKIFDDAGTNEDVLNTLVLGVDSSNSFIIPIDKSTSYDYGYDMYILYSKYEKIEGEIFAIIRGNGIDFNGKEPFGSQESEFTVEDYGIAFEDVATERKRFKICNIDNNTGDWSEAVASEDVLSINSIQTIVFLDEDCVFKQPSEYEVEIDDDKNVFIEFDEALSEDEAQNMIVILIRDDSPEIEMKTPDGFASNGFYFEINNIPYPLINANYRVR
jgi:hypothetical protein